MEDDLLQERLEHLLPNLMRKNGIDTWVIIGREYNGDPVLKTMLPCVWLSAHRRPILLLFVQGQEKGGRIAVARYDVGMAFEGAWKPGLEPNQWKQLA